MVNLDQALSHPEGGVFHVKSELKADIQSVRADIARLDKEMAVLKWMVGLVMAGVGTQLVKLFVTIRSSRYFWNIFSNHHGQA